MNRYDQLFSDDMTTKQITMLYFRLYDEVRNNENAQKELYDAHLRAWRKATKKESEAFEKALDEGYVLCSN